MYPGLPITLRMGSNEWKSIVDIICVFDALLLSTPSGDDSEIRDMMLSARSGIDKAMAAARQEAVVGLLSDKGFTENKEPLKVGDQLFRRSDDHGLSSVYHEVNKNGEGSIMRVRRGSFPLDMDKWYVNSRKGGGIIVQVPDGVVYDTTWEYLVVKWVSAKGTFAKADVLEDHKRQREPVPVEDLEDKLAALKAHFGQD